MSRVVVGVSGGVDSAVTLALLKQQGHQVQGVYLDLQGHAQDQADAQAVCQALGVPFQVLDYRAAFNQRVVQRSQQARQGDYTPNPCCWCNPTVKFRALLDWADHVGAEWVATGHYARVVDGQLYRGTDHRKDQSYFLAGLSAEQLARVILPLGDLTKTQVRAQAEQLNLPVSHKPDSTDLCFPWVGNGPTIGQGLRQGGQTQKLYYVGNGKIGTADDPALFTREVTVPEFHALVPLTPGQACLGQVRSRQVAQPCVIKSVVGETVTVTFAEPVRAVTPGQWCVLYDGTQVLGGGAIGL